MKERRKFERFDLELPARVEVETPGQKTELFSLKTSNISAGGAFFHTAQPLSEGTKVQLNLILLVEKLKKLTGYECHIKVKGYVVRSDDKGMAIRFRRNYKMIPFVV
jgi:c-di-GMP-binding flagellar brake protein YcgR